ncbi:hypothetical protein EJ110_NYTH14182 [Nymphaea thermarum]|nr:hypothetical protein EJ110_NYTH14182 [Nymphaea thermarum]
MVFDSVISMDKLMLAENFTTIDRATNFLEVLLRIVGCVYGLTQMNIMVEESRRQLRAATATILD